MTELCYTEPNEHDFWPYLELTWAEREAREGIDVCFLRRDEAHMLFGAVSRKTPRTVFSRRKGQVRLATVGQRTLMIDNAIRVT